MHSITGIVRKGNQRGRELGFPTANVALSDRVPEGIYISTVHVADKNYQAITFIGEAKTFHETVYQSETYILDFEKDIYDVQITVNLLQKIRDNEKFTTVDALILQMHDDEEKTRAYFQNI
jgi:riboflavin kinase/FMN adenylyltransferase